MLKRTLLAGLVAMCLPGTAWALNYADANNVAADFTWSNATDLFGRYGQPVSLSTQNVIAFPSANFTATAAGGASDSMFDVLNIDLTADAGLKFASITFETHGLFTLTGSSTNHVVAQGSLTATSTSPTYSDNNDYEFTENQTGSGVFWSDSTSITIPFEMPVDEVTVTADQVVQAISAAGGTATMDANFELIGIAVELYPEPASISLLAVGGMVLLRRRRR